METISLDINTKIEELYDSGKEAFSSSSALINKSREEAFCIFKKSGIPTKADERYRNINLESIFRHNYNTYIKKRAIDFKIDDVFKCDVPDLETHTILLVNGWYHNADEQLTILPGGAVIGSFLEASKKYPEIFEKHYGKIAKPEEDGLIALNTSFVQDGIFFYVPDNVILEKPVQIINILISDEDVQTMPRNLFVVGKNAQAKIVVCDHTLSAQYFLTNAVSEIFADRDSLLEIYRVQNEHNGSTQISSVFIKQLENSNVLTNTLTLHGGSIRNNINVELAGRNAENQTIGLYLCDKGQYVDNYTFIDHAVPDCYSNELFKGVLDDFASGAFSGRILVRPDAQNTRAYQSNNNILLTDDAKMNTKPQLEIYADDVKCSHGATVGQLDQNALFYLQSRGIPKKEALMMLMYGFTNEILSKITVEPLKERISGMVERRLRGELSRCNSCVMTCTDKSHSC
ncbi:MAG: Fe-S cluster assembly protein SufD [Bacteroidales bacterium]|nr:Fe-S cluster assembly protein SufD [Bacteroidales bacterium]